MRVGNVVATLSPFVIVAVALFAIDRAYALHAVKPVLGAACSTEGDYVCEDFSRLICHDKKYVAESCEYCSYTPGQVRVGGKKASSFAHNCIARGDGPEGTPCRSESLDCVGGGATIARCKTAWRSTWEHFPCRGPAGCTMKPGGADCDVSTSVEGERCAVEDDSACSQDLKRRLACRDGIWASVGSCGGPNGCRLGGGLCEMTVGDGCKADTGTCSPDGESVLLCRDGKLALGKRCRGDGGCASTGGLVQCTHADLAEVGDPCDGGISACRPDRKALLDCKRGAFVLRTTCQTCTSTGDELTCNP